MQVVFGQNVQLIECGVLHCTAIIVISKLMFDLFVLLIIKTLFYGVLMLNNRNENEFPR